MARRGGAWRGMARQGLQFSGEGYPLSGALHQRRGRAWRGMARHGWAWQGKGWRPQRGGFCPLRWVTTRGAARLGGAWLGGAWLGKARQGRRKAHQ